MGIPYEKLVKEDFNRGHGAVSVTMPGGGSASGNKVGIHSFLDKHLYVDDFGAVGDGVTDDSEKFRNALIELAAIGGRLFLRPGATYILAPNANHAPIIASGLANAVVVGYGSTLKYRNNVLGASSTASMLSFRNCHNVLVEGLTILGNRANQSGYSEFNHGIAIGDDPGAISGSDCTRIIVRHCTISGVAGDCIYIASNSQDCWIEKNRLSDPNTGGVGNARMGIGVVAAQRLWILDNAFTGSGSIVSGRMAIDLEPDTAAQAIASIVIRGNVMTSSDWNRSVSVAGGASSSWGTVSINDNVFTRYILYAPGNASDSGYVDICENTVSEGIVINRALRATVRGNSCAGQDVDSSRSAMIVLDNVLDGGVVADNVCINEGGAVITAGLMMQGNTRRIAVTGNTFMGEDATSGVTHGVYLSDSGAAVPRQIHISDNLVGIASGGTMTNAVSVANVAALKAVNLIHVGLNTRINCTNVVDDATRAYQTDAVWT